MHCLPSCVPPNCVNLKKHPSQKSVWSCPECRTDINSAIKNLRQSVVELQNTVSELSLKQERLDEENDTLRILNNQLAQEIPSPYQAYQAPPSCMLTMSHS